MMFLISIASSLIFFFFFFNDTATTEIYTLSLHDALPIWWLTAPMGQKKIAQGCEERTTLGDRPQNNQWLGIVFDSSPDRKSTRLNSSHLVISYAVFCLKKKTNDRHAVLHYALLTLLDLPC